MDNNLNENNLNDFDDLAEKHYYDVFSADNSGTENDNESNYVDPGQRLEQERAKHTFFRQLEKERQHKRYQVPAVLFYGIFFGLLNYFFVTGCNPTIKAFLCDMPYVFAWSLGLFPIWYLLYDGFFRETSDEVDEEVRSPGLISKLIVLAFMGAVVYGIYWLLSKTDGSWYNTVVKIVLGCLAGGICVFFVVKVVKIAVEEIWVHKVAGIICAIIVMLFVTNYYKYRDGDIRKAEDTTYTTSSQMQNIYITTMPHSHVDVKVYGKNGEKKYDSGYNLDLDGSHTVHYNTMYTDTPSETSKKKNKKKESKMKKGDTVKITVKRAFFDDYTTKFKVE